MLSLKHRVLSAYPENELSSIITSWSNRALCKLYSDGYFHCAKCGYMIKTEVHHCKICGRKFRTRPRNKNTMKNRTEFSESIFT